MIREPLAKSVEASLELAGDLLRAIMRGWAPPAPFLLFLLLLFLLLRLLLLLLFSFVLRVACVLPFFLFFFFFFFFVAGFVPGMEKSLISVVHHQYQS